MIGRKWTQKERKKQSEILKKLWAEKHRGKKNVR